MQKRSNKEHKYENRIREVRKLQGLALRELADRVDTTWGQLGRLERGDRDLSLTWLRKIARALGCGLPELLLPEDLHPPFVTDAEEAGPDQPFAFAKPSSGFGVPWPIPLWGAGAGYSPHGCVCFASDFLERYEIDPFRCVVIELGDVSMEPALPRGSVVLVDRRYNAMVENEICAFLLPKDRPTIRRLERAGDRWVLKAENQTYRDQLWDDAMTPLGLVLWTSRMVFTSPQQSDIAAC